MSDRILVLVTGYPTLDNLYNCSWAHTRNVHYIKKGCKVDVLFFGCELEYNIDGVDIISIDRAINRLKNRDYRAVISHSPNIRKHIPFLERYCSGVKKVLFMHGTESMWVNYDYPKPYSYMKESIYKRTLRDIYDYFKFFRLKRFILKSEDISLVFVSEWMKTIFSKNVFNIEEEEVKYKVINNSLNDSFFNKFFDPNLDKIADFITIRSFDLSKYAIDLVIDFALSNPDKTIHIYGKGKYFEYNQPPQNVTVFNEYIKQEEIPDVLNKYRFALMPTRCDAQGVMVCEMATFGMPVLTTDISVNDEMFSCFDNVKKISEQDFAKKLVTDLPTQSYSRNLERFSLGNTLEIELEYIIN
ncbi:glycosyltransferase family protein [Vibrio jasicida]|uniref:hypothetical protein n=1 Tax=Vibrio jasicida TaxID=766224 RepID=UPI00163DE98E|nr:hypothetical protein [Vibrio jasicida]